MDAFTFSAAGDFSQFERGAQSAWDRAQGYVNKRPLRLKIDDQASLPLGRISAGLNNFERALDASTKRVLAFGITAQIFAKLEQGVGAFVRSTINVQDALVRINIGLAQNQKGLESFKSSLFNIARDTGQSFDETAKAAERLSKQNLGVAETTKRLREVMILARIAGVDSVEAFNAMTSTLATFKKEGLNGSDVIDRLTVANNKFGVSAEVFTEAIQRSGLVAQQAGVNFNQLLGIITAVQRITGRDGAAIGTSLTKVFAGLEKPETREKLNSYGISVKNNQGSQLSGYDVLQNIAVKRASGKLSQNDQANILETISGQRQEENTIALLDELAKKYNLVTKSIQGFNSANGAANDTNEKRNQSLRSLITGAGTSFTQLASNIGDRSIGPSTKSGIDGLNEIRKLLSGDKNSYTGEGSEVGKYVGDGIIKGLANVISGPGIALFGRILFTALSKSIQFGAADLKSLLGINKAGLDRAEIQVKINSLLQTASQKDLQAINNAQTLLEKNNAILRAIQNINRAKQISSTNASALAGTFQNEEAEGIIFRGKRGKGLAGGYLPAVMSEISDISNGVGGASSTARPVSIPNFNFGNGHIGSVVANTDEYMVPNFAGGGDAIFNKDMVAKYGVPSNARHLAGGYVPNFAKSSLEQREAAIREAGFNASSSELYNLPSSVARGPINTKQREQLQRIMLEYAESTKVGTALQNQLNKGLEKASKFLNEDSLSQYKRVVQRSREPSIISGSVNERKLTQEELDEVFKDGGGPSNYGVYDGGLKSRSNARAIAIQQYKKNKLIVARQERNAKIQKAGFGASLALPFLAGFLPEGEQGTAGGTALGALGGAIQYGSAGASVGGLPGAIGGSIGGALFGGLEKASKSVDQLVEELSKGDELGQKFALGEDKNTAIKFNGDILNKVIRGDRSNGSLNYLQGVVARNTNSDVNGLKVTEDNAELIANAIRKSVNIIANSVKEAKDAAAQSGGRIFLGPKDFLNYNEKSTEGFGAAGANSRFSNFDTSRNGFLTATQRAQGNLGFYKEFQEQNSDITDLDSLPGYKANRQVVQRTNALRAGGDFLRNANPGGRYFDFRGEPIAQAVEQGLAFKGNSINADVRNQAGLLADKIKASEINPTSYGLVYSGKEQSGYNTINGKQVSKPSQTGAGITYGGTNLGKDRKYDLSNFSVDNSTGVDVIEQINKLDEISKRVNEAKAAIVHRLEIEIKSTNSGYDFEKNFTGNPITDLITQITKLVQRVDRLDGKYSPPTNTGVRKGIGPGGGI